MLGIAQERRPKLGSQRKAEADTLRLSQYQVAHSILCLRILYVAGAGCFI
jgi:hypothetical protein